MRIKQKQLAFDYAIIGAGASGLKLAMAMKKEPFFNEKKIVLFDLSRKDLNDKTYSFWEEGVGPWDSIVAQQWKAIEIFDSQKKRHIKSLNQLIYKQINSIDFYNYCFNELGNDSRFEIFHEKVKSIQEFENHCIIHTNERTVSCKKIFDSRVEPEFRGNEEKHLYIKQTFIGWFVKTEKPVFNPDAFTFMDFRLQYKDSTSFTYILPQSTDLALLEFTLFANYTLPKAVFEEKLVEYMDTFYPGINYTVVEKERNIHPIPMTTYKFDRNYSEKVLKIGVAGGWTKPCSGFTFKRGEKYITKILAQLKNNKKITPGYKLISKRFLFYDKLLLRVLKYQEYEGTRIFVKMFEASRMDILFRFLDEETTIWEEFRLMLKLPKWPFIKALFSKD